MTSAKISRKLFVLFLLEFMVLSLAACAGNRETTLSDSNILVAYFSHTGENYSVGVVEKGNTHIIADMIAEESGFIN